MRQGHRATGPCCVLIGPSTCARAAFLAVLQVAGWHPQPAPDVTEALGAAARTSAEVVLVLARRREPRLAATCRALRAGSRLPIVVVAAPDCDWIDRIEALAAGADDVVPGDVHPHELQARVRAIARRGLPVPPALGSDVPGSPALASDALGSDALGSDALGSAALGSAAPSNRMMVVGPLFIDLDRHSVTVNGTPKHLTRKEFQLLTVLSSAPDRTVRRDQLTRHVWRREPHGLEHTLESHITSLRHKLGLRALIKTVRGVGYRIDTAALPPAPASAPPPPAPAPPPSTPPTAPLPADPLTGPQRALAAGDAGDR